MKKLIEAYMFCPTCKNKLEDKDLHKYCGGCKRHLYINPSPAVSVVVSNDNNEILLVRRALEPLKGYWDLPGGFMELDESMEEAGRRELKEETGLTVNELAYVGSYPASYDFEDYEYALIVSVFETRVGTTVTIRVDDDASDYKFVSVNEINLEEIAFKQQQDFLKAYIKRAN